MEFRVLWEFVRGPSDATGASWALANHAQTGPDGREP